MYLSITQRGDKARNLGYLLVKHPDRAMSKETSAGTVHVFFPRADDDECTAVIMLDADPINSMREKGAALADYVAADGYVSGSHFLGAMNAVLNSAISGKCRDMPELDGREFDFEFCMPSVLSTGGTQMVNDLFVPLGYAVNVVEAKHEHDFLPEAGKILEVKLRKRGMLSDCLRQISVLIAVMANNRYFVPNDNDVEMVTKRGEGWLVSHPRRDFIIRRFLDRRQRLIDEVMDAIAVEDDARTSEPPEARGMGLHRMRLAFAAAVSTTLDAHSVLDGGCGEGKLLHMLLANRKIARLVGCDISSGCLERARRKLRIDHFTVGQKRVQLHHASIADEHDWARGHDVVFLVEVIEHMAPEELGQLGDSLLGVARPDAVFATTPERDYNKYFPDMKGLRHPDHKFEFTRAEFGDWAVASAAKHNYSVCFVGIGPQVDGSTPTQGCLFMRGRGRDVEAAEAIRAAVELTKGEADAIVRQ